MIKRGFALISGGKGVRDNLKFKNEKVKSKD
jgi:hypothetical protein